MFPNGKTLHVPSDGKPLPGFNQALASYKARKKSGNVAIASLGKSSTSSSRRSGSLLAAFFGGGGGADDEEDSSGVTVASGGDEDAAAPQPRANTRSTARVDKQGDGQGRQQGDGQGRRQGDGQVDDKATAKVDNKIRILPPELANPVDLPPVAQQETIVAALPARDVPLPLAAPRPQVDVGAVAQSSGGLYATADQPAPGDQPADQPAEQEVALNVPLPMPRPGNAPPPELDADSRDQAVIVAAATAETASDMDLPLPAARPSDTTTDEIAPLIAALPDEEPGEEPGEGEDSYTVASVPAVASANDAFPASPDEIIPQAKATDPTMLGYAATPRAAVVNRAPGTNPASAVSSGVKTTPKAARPVRKDAKQDAKPKVIAAQPQAARWALDSSYVLANTKGGTKVLPLAHNLVRSAPSEVYTAGFEQGTQVADARRFSGKAVTFMTVARFSTN